MSYFMKTPCAHCPYRNDVKPFLTPERGEELAYHAQNPYNTFPCHKTTEYDEDSDCGDMYAGEKSKECAGFMTLQVQEGMNIPKGFEPAYDIVYGDTYEMVDAYDDQY
jgi:hypothetical protein